MTLVPPIPSSALQQHLPFTVLKLVLAMIDLFLTLSCNSAYRLRY